MSILATYFVAILRVLVICTSLAETVFAGRPEQNYSLALRVQVLMYLAMGWKIAAIIGAVGMSKAAIYALKSKATKRGWSPGELVQMEHVVDSPRSGRPRAISERTGRILLDLIRTSSGTRQFSAKRIAHELRSKHQIKVSASTVKTYLAKNGFKKVKTTKKPGLTRKQMDARYRFCLAVMHWSLEDWKNVIFSDETSVQLGVVRGMQRIWRRGSERQNRQCVRSRWKGRQEFMFWGCFRWAGVGPCLIWNDESPKERKAADLELDSWNAEHEAEHRAKWDAEQGEKNRLYAVTRNMKGLSLGQRTRCGATASAVDQPRRPGRQPVWKHTDKTGAKTRKGKGGIDWYRYGKYCLGPVFIPFVEQCRQTNPFVVAQEDNAPAHRSKWNQELWSERGIRKIGWPGNSPDLNAIEPLWMKMKRDAGMLTSRKQASTVFRKIWNEMPAETCHRFVERIPGNVKWVLVLHGGNTYKEGTCPPPEVWEAWLDERELEVERREYRVGAAEAITDWEAALRPPENDESEVDWEDVWED